MVPADVEDLLSQTGRVTRGSGAAAGNGTVQEAFSYLTKAGTILVESHEAQGSFLITSAQQEVLNRQRLPRC
jgi:cellobiose-specific phosphotransferase system component IIA